MEIAEIRKLFCIPGRGILLALLFVLSFSFSACALTAKEAKLAKGEGWHDLPGGKITYIQKDKSPAEGFLKLEKRWYHFDEDGYLSLGWFIVKGKRYYALETGKTGKKKGSLLSGYEKVDGVYYLFDEKDKAGKFGAQLTGWVQVKKNVFYYEADGTKLLGLKKVDGKLYYFVPDGSRKKRGSVFTGWNRIDGKRYYFRTSGNIGKNYGAAYRNQTVRINGNTYTFDKDGVVTDMEIAASASQKKFIEKIGKLAHEDMKKTGVLASVTVAQAIVESGFGTSVLAKKANNLFGMKAEIGGKNWESEWDGKTYKKQTPEYLNGGYTTITASFRKYPDIAASVADHSAYLLGAKLPNGTLRYKGIKGCKDYKKTATIIKSGGYATAPTYVSALVSVIEKYDLGRFDEDY